MGIGEHAELNYKSGTPFNHKDINLLEKIAQQVMDTALLEVFETRLDANSTCQDRGRVPSGWKLR